MTRKSPTPPDSIAIAVSKFLCLLTVIATGICSMVAAVFLPAWWVDRILAAGPSATATVALYPTNPANLDRSAWAYDLAVGDIVTRGTNFLSEAATPEDRRTEGATAVARYAVADPRLHRLEPVDRMEGIRLVGLFPWLLGGAVFFAVAGWLLAGWEHAPTLLSGSPAAGIDVVVLAVNALGGGLLLVGPGLGLAAASGAIGAEPFYAPWVWPLGVGALLLAAIFIMLASYGNRLDAWRHQVLTSGRAEGDPPPGGPIL